MQSVATWASGSHKPYIVTTQLPIQHERLLDDSIVTVWPAPTVVMSAVALNVRLLLAGVRGRQRILILTYGETADLIEGGSYMRQRFYVETKVGRIGGKEKYIEFLPDDGGWMYSNASEEFP